MNINDPVTTVSANAAQVHFKISDAMRVNATTDTAEINATDARRMVTPRYSQEPRPPYTCKCFGVIRAAHLFSGNI